MINETKIDFPRLLLCSDSMHSKQKVQRSFPGLSQRDMQLLYGKNLENFRNHTYGCYRFQEKPSVGNEIMTKIFGS